MLNYEDLIGDILSYVGDEKVSGCNADFLEMNGFKRNSDDGDEYFSYSFISENKENGNETVHTVIFETLTGDVIYTENDEDFVSSINEPRYVSDLTLEMQELIYTELNRSIVRMITDLRK